VHHPPTAGFFSHKDPKTQRPKVLEAFHTLCLCAFVPLWLKNPAVGGLIFLTRTKKAWDFHPKPRHMNHNHFKPIGLACASLQDIRPATFTM
jgi:hypothetical protein